MLSLLLVSCMMFSFTGTATKASAAEFQPSVSAEENDNFDESPINDVGFVTGHRITFK